MNFLSAFEAIRARVAELIDAVAFDPMPALDLASGEIEDQLQTHRAGLFLGLYDEAFLRAALESVGLLPAARARIGADVRLRIDPEGGMMRGYRADRPEGPDALVVELKARAEPAPPDDLAAKGFPPGPVLVIDWLLMQDPGRPFAPGRGPLPGQTHPGLGVGPLVLDAMRRSARRLGATAVIGIPAYYHAAVLYHRSFAFADPAEEGRFQALMRDLAALPLEEASRAVEAGRVRDATFDRPLRWEGKPMILPMTDAARAYLKEPRYIDAAARALLGTRFTIE